MPTRVKRYEEQLDRLDELLERIESEMGAEAELETRRFSRGKILGLWGGQQMVEVVATLEVEAPPAAPEVSLTAPIDSSKVKVEQVDDLGPSPAGDEYKDSEAGYDTTANLVDQISQTHAPTIDVIADDPIDTQSGPPDSTFEVNRFRAGIRGIEPQAVQTSPEPPDQEPQEVVESTPLITEALPDAVKSGGKEDRPAQDAKSDEIRELKDSISELKQAVQLVLEQQLHVAEQQLDAPPAESTDGPVAQQLPLISLGNTDPLAAEGLAGGTKSSDINRMTVLDPVSIDPGTSLSAIPRKVFDRILEWNVGSYDAIELINKALSTLEGESEVTEDGLVQTISRDICRNILLSSGIKLKPSPSCKVVALIGGTGVGKTTTIAKLAAQFAFQAGKRVSLVSLDNYRIAAAEQLRTYTDIMGIDLDIVFSRDEFDDVLTQRRHSDLVLIDTAGRSPLNTKQIFELRDVFSAHPPDEVHLVISASTKGDDLKMIIENFEPLSYDHVIVSKLDETRSLGCIFNINKLCKIPISYFTVGQSVPEDIRTATLSFIQTWIEQGRIL